MSSAILRVSGKIDFTVKRGNRDLKRQVSWASDWSNADHHDDRLKYVRINLPRIKHGRGDLMAVMDGHNGPQTAVTLEKKVDDCFRAWLSRSRGDVQKAFGGSVAELSELVKNEYSGSTLSAVYVPDDEDRAYGLSLGDSPVIIESRDGTIFEGPLHNIRCNLKEFLAALERNACVIAKGGYLAGRLFPSSENMPYELMRGLMEGNFSHGHTHVFDVDAVGLQMTRSLGDAHLDFVSREPELFSVDSPRWILVASDGITTFRTRELFLEQKAILIKQIEQGYNADELVASALMAFPGDEATAIIWRALGS